MAQTTRIILSCDLDGDETTAVGTVTLGYQGSTYVVDLCEKHREVLSGALQGWIAAARRVDGGTAGHRLT